MKPQIKGHAQRNTNWQIFLYCFYTPTDNSIMVYATIGATLCVSTCMKNFGICNYLVQLGVRVVDVYVTMFS